MDSRIKEIAEKFLEEEGIPTKTAILMASLGLNKDAGDIADIAYGINFNQHAYNEERQKQMVDYLGYVMLNWQILALSTGLSADEISKRFAAEWMTKRTGKASIKDLLKHLKPRAMTTPEPVLPSKPTTPTTPRSTTTSTTTKTQQPLSAPTPTMVERKTTHTEYTRQM